MKTHLLDFWFKTISIRKFYEVKYGLNTTTIKVRWKYPWKTDAIFQVIITQRPKRPLKWNANDVAFVSIMVFFLSCVRDS